MNLNKLYQRIRISTDTLQEFSENDRLVDQEGLSTPTRKYLLLAKDNGGKELFSSWNWAAFFFGWIWLVYRRAYKEAFGSFVVSSSFFSGVIENAVRIDLWVSDFFELDFYAYFLTAGFIILYFCAHGLFGDAIYIHSLKRQIYKKPEESLKPNIWIPVGWVVALFLLIMLAVFSAVADKV